MKKGEGEECDAGVVKPRRSMGRAEKSKRVILKAVQKATSIHCPLLHKPIIVI